MIVFHPLGSKSTSPFLWYCWHLRHLAILMETKERERERERENNQWIFGKNLSEILSKTRKSIFQKKKKEKKLIFFAKQTTKMLQYTRIFSLVYRQNWKYAKTIPFRGVSQFPQKTRCPRVNIKLLPIVRFHFWDIREYELTSASLLSLWPGVVVPIKALYIYIYI